MLDIEILDELDHLQLSDEPIIIMIVLSVESNEIILGNWGLALHSKVSIQKLLGLPLVQDPIQILVKSCPELVDNLPHILARRSYHGVLLLPRLFLLKLYLLRGLNIFVHQIRNKKDHLRS